MEKTKKRAMMLAELKLTPDDSEISWIQLCIALLLGEHSVLKALQQVSIEDVLA